ncbi:DinB family protein [Dyadobacter psychrotolerans]|uniref:Damage-inducible protein DinB n=1 Tax=Dyadobacter psychrotolerans TaxID=2541721 RepID=A0A4R5DMF1_9BACT|nr:DinB family protein [Dyadobacter psychrotolerans]TDE14677.1 damage-inducible protein DinB [Dyadobacter psychrotolerans]
MENTATENEVLSRTVTITPEQLRSHWQEHRSLSRRMIEAFPENEIYTFSIGGMRNYADLTMEMIDLAGAGVKGIATGDWSGYGDSGQQGHSAAPTTKQELLALWDSVTEKIETYWPQIAPERFQERDNAFGMYEGPIHGTLLYLIDNEIHHRGQGYVYLRALGVEPPAFWDRNMG